MVLQRKFLLTVFDVYSMNLLPGQRQVRVKRPLNMPPCHTATTSSTIIRAISHITETLRTMQWTGDVWKLLPILQKYRPDLRITVLNCTSTGLVVVSGLAPGNGILSQNYDAIIKAYVDLDLEKFGVEAFFASFTFTDAQAFLDIGAPMFANIAMDAVQVQTPVFISP